MHEMTPHSGDTGALGVLIADDDPRVCRALRAFIEADPFLTVAGEANGADALLHSLQASAPSVILLDLVLPRAEEGLRLLRLLAATQSKPVVAMSLRGDLRAAALEAGAYAFVEKDGVPDRIRFALLAAGSGARGAPPLNG